MADLESHHKEGIGEIIDIEWTAQEERKVIWKIDLIMIPLMGVAYMLQFMDKLALGQATQFNLRQDLNLHGSQFSWATAIFYFGYFIWSSPSSYLLVRLPLGKFLGISVFIWGGILMCHAAARNFGGLAAARFMLGVGEASIAPGFGLLVGLFYKREEQPARQLAWFAGNCISLFFGGLIAYGIGKIDAPAHVTNWQLLFLILGAVTSAYGILLAFCLPDAPSTAKFLTEREQNIAMKRCLSNRTGTQGKRVFQWNQVLQALKDPQVWFIVLGTFCSNIANGGSTAFLSILISGFGFSHLKSLLMQMPIAAAQLVLLLISCVLTTSLHSTRVIAMALNAAVAMMGMVLVWQLDEDNRVGRLAGLCLSGALGINIPLSLSIVSSNIAGFTKKSVVSALIFIAYCVGNIVGPQFYLASQEPHYQTGITSAVSGLALSTFFFVCLFTYYVWENRRRDATHGSISEDYATSDEVQDSLEGKTDREMRNFRYVL